MPCIPHREPSHKAISLWLLAPLLLCSMSADSAPAAIMQTPQVVWIVRADAGIRTSMDLAGKRVLLMPTPESAELLITLCREGIDIDRLPLRPTSFNLQDLLNGKSDAYDGYISNASYWLSQHGAKYRLRDYGMRFYNDEFYIREQLVARSPLLKQQPVSASFGIAQLAPVELLRDPVRNPDAALSRTKQLGRNRVAS